MPDHATSALPAISAIPAARIDAGPAAALMALGFDLPAATARATAAGGVAEKISVRAILDDADVAKRFRYTLERCARQGAPVSYLVLDLGREAAAATRWAAFCQFILDTVGPGRRFSWRPGFCLHSHALPLEEYCEIADSLLGRGPRYVFLDSLQMNAHGDARVTARSDSNWVYLWKSRGSPRPLRPVYGGLVRSACPLLADEVATAALPGAGLQVPAGSAWLALTLDLTRFADAAGVLDEPRLCKALTDGLPLADELLDELRWSLDAQRQDARRNRRLAVNLAGIGDLVARRRSDPADLDCLRDLERTVALIRRVLDETSAALARQRGPVPSLAQCCPPDDWFDGSHNEIWRKRFEAARRHAAVRHRNLLAMSPYAVLPAASSYGAAFADLLPLLRHADAWSFASPARFPGWNVKQFKYFHKRARAIVQSSQVATVIAAGE